MKAMKKSALALLVCSAITLPTVSLTAFADGSTKNALESVAECQGDFGYGISHIPLETQLEEFLNDPNRSEENKQAVKEKIEVAIASRDSAASGSRSSNSANVVYPTVTLSVPAYTQINYYYCGPATTKQTLQYLGYVVPGTYYSPTQETIAEAIGTTTNGTEWYRIRNYLNSFTFMGIATNYVEYCPTSSADMAATIYSGLTATNPQPPILQINTDGNSSVLGYPTDGHYLNVSGIKTEDGVTYFQLTDPNRGRKNLTPKYDITVDKAYEFTMNHWAGHFLY